MPFLIRDEQLPATATAGPLTDDEFAALCAQHPDLSFEMTAEGEVIIAAAAFSLTAARNSKICRYLDAWAEKDSRGIVCDSSGGFVLPNGARRSPDASWTLKSRIPQHPSSAAKGFWHLCPDFVVELRSDTGRLKALQQKMQEYLANGAQLGWLIDADHQTIEIYRPGVEAEIRKGIDRIEGEGPVAGFILELALVWNPMGQ